MAALMNPISKNLSIQYQYKDEVPMLRLMGSSRIYILIYEMCTLSFPPLPGTITS